MDSRRERRSRHIFRIDPQKDVVHCSITNYRHVFNVIRGKVGFLNDAYNEAVESLNNGLTQLA